MQKHIKFLIYILLHTFIDRNNQLIRLILRQLPLRINYWLHTCMNELLFEHIEILKLILLIYKIVFQSCNRTFHVQNTFFFAM